MCFLFFLLSLFFQSHIAHADARFTPGLQSDEMHHLVNRFLTPEDGSTERKVNYHQFFEHYTRQIENVDEDGFVNIGQLPTTGNDDSNYNNTTNSDSGGWYQIEQARRRQEEEEATDMDETKENENVEHLASRLASLAEREMYSGGEALDPSMYEREIVAPPNGHDQTERINRALLGAMLHRMNGTAKPIEVDAGSFGSNFSFDPSILSETELEQLMATRR